MALLADFNKSDFTTIEGFPHPTQQMIMPVVAVKGEMVDLLGTCFAVCNEEIVLPPGTFWLMRAPIL